MSPIGLLFVAATVWMVFMVRRKRNGWSGVSMLTTLGVVSVLAGLFVFGTRSSRDEHRVAAASRIHRAHRIDRVARFLEDVPQIHVEPPHIEPPHIDLNFDRGFPFQAGDIEFHDAFDFQDAGMPKWMTISLGSLLLIVGTLLATRHRTRPLAMKALTVLGVGAVAFSLVSFFGSTPRGMGNRDRVVRVAAHDQREERGIDTRGTGPTEKSIAPRAKRPSRAKRPASRPERPTGGEAPIPPMPPRAGSIPVEAELVDSRQQSAAPAAPAPAASAAPAAAPLDKPAVPPESRDESAVAPEDKAKPEAAPAAAEAPAKALLDKPAVAHEEKPAATPDTAVPAVTPATTQTPAAAPTAAAPAVVAQPSVPPVTPPVGAQGRPAWVDAPPRLANSVYSITVNSGLFVSVPECQRELDSQIKHEADHYIDEYLGERASPLVNIPISYLKEHVKKAECAELVQSESVGPMHQIHALLEFDDQARGDFRRLWHNAIVTDRLWYTGSGAALLLALLGTFYGYLKLDLRTGGAQKGRLQLAATLVALIVAAGALLARWAVPF